MLEVLILGISLGTGFAIGMHFALERQHKKTMARCLELNSKNLLNGYPYRLIDIAKKNGDVFNSKAK